MHKEYIDIVELKKLHETKSCHQLEKSRIFSKLGQLIGRNFLTT